MSVDLRSEAENMFGKGLTPGVIAEELGIDLATVKRYLGQEELATTVRSEIVAIDDERAALIVNAYKGGSDTATVCKDFDITVRQLWSLLDEYGVPKHGEVARKTFNERFAIAVTMYENNRPMREITAKTGIHPPTFYANYTAAGGKLKNERHTKKHGENATDVPTDTEGR